MQGKGNTNSEIPHMSNHMETCLKCKNEYFYNSQSCPNCNSINIKISNWIPETLKLEYIDKCNKQLTPVTKKFLKNEFKKILKKYKKTPHSLVLKKIHNVPLGIISHNDYNERLELQYNITLLSTYTIEEIICLLECRVLILNGMKSTHIKILNIPGIQNISEIYVDYMTEFTILYDSYLMYKNYPEFFKNNKIIYKIKNNELTNFAIINQSLIHMIKSDMNIDPTVVLLMITKIFHDALYFIFFNKKILYEHAKKYDYEHIVNILEWVVNDFKMIDDSKSTKQQINDVTQLIGHLLSYIDSITFILKKKIVFLPDTVYRYKKLDINFKNIYKKITETWLNRLHVHEASSIEYFRNVDEKINELKNILKQFKPDQLLNFITLIITIPENTKYSSRFEFLFKLIISIPNNEFNFKVLKNDDVDIVLKKLDDFAFDINENDNIIGSNDQPSLWILGKKYKMLSGQLMRAYESWKDLVSEYEPLQNKFESIVGYNPISIILNVLSLQTTLFEFINQKNIVYRKTNSIIIPSLDKIVEWEQIIINWKNNLNHDFYIKYKINTDDITWTNIDMGESFIEEINNMELHNFCFYEIKNKLILIPQQSIFLFLKYTFSQIIKNNSNEFEQLVVKNTKKRIYNKLLLFENEVEIIPNFSINNSFVFDFGLIFDLDKLFLIKIISNDFTDESLNKQIHILDDQLHNLKKLIDSNAIKFINNKKISGMNINEFEIIPIIIIKTYDDVISLIINQKKYLKNKTLWHGTLIDFLSLMSFTKEFMDFLVFLRHDQDMQDNSIVHSMNSMDRYAHYIINNAYLQIGTTNNYIKFELNQWEQYLIMQLKKLPDYQPKLLLNEPDDFWNIRQINDKIIEVYNPQINHVARIFFVGKYDVWIHSIIPLKYCTTEERMLILALIDLIPYRVTKNNLFQKLLNKMDIKNKQIHFRLASFDNMAHENMITNKIEFSVKGIKTKNTIYFNITYSINFILKLFENDRLGAEKEIMRRIIDGIVSYYCKTLEHNNLVDEFIKKLFALSNPAFNISIYENPLDTKQFPNNNYAEPLMAFLHMEHLKTARYLFKKSFTPKKYSGIEAKNIFDQISNIQLQEFDQIISQYSIRDLAPFILDLHGKLIESRYNLNLKTKNNLKLPMEFNPKSEYDESSNDLGITSITIRYILERIISIHPTGKKKITREIWYKLQAIIRSLLSDTVNRNMIYYKTGDILFQINPDYSHEIKYVDIERMKKHLRNIEYEIFETSSSSINLNEDQILKMIENPFYDEFGVIFSNFCKILLRCIIFIRSKDENTMLIPKQTLIDYIKNSEKNISIEEINSSLILCSIIKDELNEANIFVTDTRNRKNRLIVKPIIMLNSFECVINAWSIQYALMTWKGFILEGYLPFKHDFTNLTLRNSLSHVQHIVSKNLEKNITAIIKKYTQYCFNNIKNSHPCFIKLENFPGEIDILALFPTKKIILLIEIKSVHRNTSSLDIYKEIQKYNKEYVEKLTLKKSFINERKNKILSFFDIKQSENWKTEALFVTNRHQFNIPNIAFPIISINDLDEKIKNDFLDMC